MKRIKIRRVSRTLQKDISIVREIIFDYTHFLYRHKSSFKDFRVISDKNFTQIFYYETKIFNWLPFSPVIKFISIKKLLPEKNMFTQSYINLKNKSITYLKCYLKEENSSIAIYNDFSLPVSNFIFLLRKLIVPLINIKLDVMWKEDEEMLNLRDRDNEQDSIYCVPKTFNLEEIKENNFNKFINENFEPDFFYNLKD